MFVRPNQEPHDNRMEPSTHNVVPVLQEEGWAVVTCLGNDNPMEGVMLVALGD